MKGSKVLGILSILILTVLCVGLVNAQTLVAGKVYDSNFTQTLSGIDISITCQSGAKLSTTSTTDGVYGVKFEAGNCSLGDNVDVVATNGHSGSESGTLDAWPVPGSSITKFSIINIKTTVVSVTTPPGSGGGGGGGSGGDYYYFCGNGICNSGESSETCPEDCKETQILDEGDEGLVPSIFQLNEETETQSLFSRITGAVTGALGTAGTAVVVIFLVGILGSFIAVRVVRAKKTSIATPSE